MFAMELGPPNFATDRRCCIRSQRHYISPTGYSDCCIRLQASLSYGLRHPFEHRCQLPQPAPSQPCASTDYQSPADRLPMVTCSAVLNRRLSIDPKSRRRSRQAGVSMRSMAVHTTRVSVNGRRRYFILTRRPSQ